MKKHLERWIVYIVGFIMMIPSMFYQGSANLVLLAGWLRNLSNAALVPGIIYLLLAMVIFISNEGFLEIAKYAGHTIKDSFFKKERKYKSYFEYMNRKREKFSVKFFLLPAIIYIGISVVFAVIFNIL